MANNLDINIRAQIKEAVDSINKFGKEATSTLKEVEKSTKDASGSINKFSDQFNSLGSTVKVAAGALAALYAGQKLIGFLQNATESASKFESALLGVQGVAESLGISTDEITTAVKSLAEDGLIPVQDAATSLQNLLASGLSLPQSIELINALKDSAAFGRKQFLSLGQAVLDATQGIKNGNSILVDNANITKNLSILQREYAASIGTTAGKLSDTQKVFAAYVGILRESRIFTGNAAKLSETYSGAISRLNATYELLNVTIGEFITKSPVASAIVDNITNVFSGLNATIIENAEGIRTFIKDFVSGSANVVGFVSLLIANFIRFFDVVFSGFKALNSQFTVFIQGALKGVEGAINSLSKKLGSSFNVGTEAAKEYEIVVKNAATATKEFEKALSGKNTFDKITESAVNFATSIERANVKQNKLSDGAKKLKKESVDAINAGAEAAKKQASFLQDLAGRIEQITRAVQDQISRSAQSPFNLLFGIKADTVDFTRQIQALDTALKEGTITQDQYAESIDKINKLAKEFDANQIIGSISGILNAAAGGAEGARQLVVQGAQAAADAIVPGLGRALGPLFDAFSKGPEFVKQQVQEFAKALPGIINGFIEAIPVFITELIAAIPQIIDELSKTLPDTIIRIIDGLVENLPRIVEAFVNIFATQAPLIATRLAIAFVTKIVPAFIRQIPEIIEGFASGLRDAAGGFVQALIDEVTGAVGSVGKGAGNFIGDVGDFLGFAQGGQGFVKQVPGGFPNDAFPAALTSGELVVDRSTAFRLKEFLNNQPAQSGGDSEVTTALLSKILTTLQQPQQVSTSVSLNQKAFADIILKLNKTNQRLA